MSATLLDGDRKINLLSNGGCYEVVGELVQKKELNFTLLELESFIKSEPARFTVEELNIYQKKIGKTDSK